MDVIYGKGHEPSASSDAHRIVALARVGVAASDSVMNVDLMACGYTDFFDVIGRIASNLAVEIEELERLAKVGPIYGRKTEAQDDT